jgi:V/A-type H+-transporting ATPase subunit C
LLDQIFDPYGFPFWILIFSIIIAIFGLILRPFLTHVKFAYPNALFEAIGNPFIGEKDLSRVIDSKDLSGFKESINTLKDYSIEGENTHDIQRSLDDHFIQTMKMMRKDSPKEMSDFYDIYLEKLDVRLIKKMIKNKLENKPVEEIKIDETNLPAIQGLLEKLKDAEKKDLPEILSDYGFGTKITDIISQEKADFLALDSEIDKHVISKFRLVKVPYKCEQAKQKFINRMIDILNVKNVLRAKQLGYDNESCKKLFLGEGQEIASWKFKEMTEVDQVSQVISSVEGTSYYGVLKDAIEEYNKEGSVQVLENVLDGLFLKLMRDLSLQHFISIGPTIRFLISKEFEIQNLKIIAKGIGENLSSDIIKKFVVMEARS